MITRKKIIAILAICATLCIGIGLSACTSTQLLGFEIRETLSVKYGEIIEIEHPLVTENGNILDVSVSVKSGNGVDVPILADSFTAEDTKGYSIIYTIVVHNGELKQKTTSVTVAPPLKLITAKIERVVTVGESVSLNAKCDDPEVSLNYEIVPLNEEGTMEDIFLDTSKTEFILYKAGEYRVTISSQDEGVYPFSYTVVARDEMCTGEVERFTAQWQSIENFTGGNRTDFGGYKTTTSDECGLLDHKGNEATFLCMETSAEYPQIYIFPRGTKSYYQSLVDEGYEYISFWIYMKSEKGLPHKTSHKTDPVGGKYNIITEPLYPEQWTEYRLSLNGTDEYDKSFLQLYESYVNRKLYYIQISNSVAYDPIGGNDSLKLYIGDVYAVKPASIDVSESAQSSFTTGASVSLDNMFSSAEETKYFVSYNGSKNVIEGDSYTFAAPGIYTIDAICSAYNLAGKATYSVIVTDPFTIHGRHVSKQLTEGKTEILFSEVEPDLETISSYKPSITGRQVLYNNKEIVIEQTGFSANKVGIYVLKTKIEYIVSDIACTTFIESIIDVYDQNHAEMIANADSAAMTAGKIYYGSWEKEIDSVDYLSEYEGVSNVMKVTVNGTQEVGIAVNPIYSVEYYTELLASIEEKNAQAMVYFQYRVENIVEPELDRVISFIQDEGMSEWSNVGAKSGIWHTVSISLKDFIRYLDDIRANYVGVTSGSFSKIGNSVPQGWLFKISTAPAKLAATEVYLSEINVYATAADLPVSNSDVQLVEKNSDISIKNLYEIDKYANMYEFVWHLTSQSGDIQEIDTETIDASELNNGLYKLTLTAYLKGTSYGTVVYTGELDIYDAQTPDMTIAEAGESGMIASKMYNYELKDIKKIVASEYIRNETYGTVMKVTANTDRTGIAINALHSKAYYEMLLNSGTTYNVKYSYRLADGNGWTEFLSEVAVMKGETIAVGSWQTRTLTLSDFIAWMEGMRTNYEKAKNGEFAAEAIANNTTPPKNWLIGENASEFYITGISLVPASN